MKCPKCDSPLVTLRVEDDDVARCTGCLGLWFDAGALDRLRTRPGADAIDEGAASVGHKYDGKVRVPCPRCNVPMIRMIHIEQNHIWYETCGTCGGSWLDAGEFRDLSHHTLLDVIRDWFARPRR